MSITNPDKTVVPGSINCNGTAKVTISFDAAATLASDPADVILMMDRSSSMAPPRIDYAKAAADQFIDIFSDASGSRGGSVIKNGSRIGILSFSSSASEDVQLTDQVSVLKSAIDAIKFGGSTNHETAFKKAEGMFPPKDKVRQIAVLFTDGVSTGGGDAKIITDRMKASGIEIYCIGLGDNRTQIDSWCSLPVSTHVVSDADPEQLGRMFREIAAEVVMAGAMDIKIKEKLDPDFSIVGIDAPLHGKAEISDPHNLIWSMDSAGLSEQPEKISLSFDVMHTGATGGIKYVNRSIEYEDRAGTALVFPDPVVNVLCGSGTEILPEPCPVPTDIIIKGCSDTAHAAITDVLLQGLGRIVQLDVTVKNVCPGKRVAASVMLSETGPGGEEQPRGIKHFLIPAHSEDSCRDITLKCIQFSLPEELDINGDKDSVCNPRNFSARVIANYIDTDFVCCEEKNIN